VDDCCKDFLASNAGRQVLTYMPENIGQFYGWPDFFGNAEPGTDPKFASPKNSQPLQFLIQNHPPVVKPDAVLDVGAGHPTGYSSSNQGLESGSANNSSDISNQSSGSSGNFGLDNGREYNEYL
jgi:hypothetical protein